MQRIKNYKQIFHIPYLLKIFITNDCHLTKNYEKRKGLFLKHEYLAFSNFAR